jgi:hypothetical protein
MGWGVGGGYQLEWAYAVAFCLIEAARFALAGFLFLERGSLWPGSALMQTAHRRGRYGELGSFCGSGVWVNGFALGTARDEDWERLRPRYFWLMSG